MSTPRRRPPGATGRARALGLACALGLGCTLGPAGPAQAQGAGTAGAIGRDPQRADPSDSTVRDTRGTAALAAAPATQTGGIEAWGGMANASPQWGILGETPGMRFGVLAVRWSRVAGARPAAGELPALEWTIDLIPVARISPPLVSLRGTGQPCTTAVLCVLAADPADAGYLFPPDAPLGVGFAPLGVTRRWRRGARISPFVGANGGAIWFTSRVPTTKASHFNFTASGEAGLRFGRASQPGVTLTYRFHHLSNAGTAGENPGVASHLITVGVHRPRLQRGASPGRP